MIIFPPAIFNCWFLFVECFVASWVFLRETHVSLTQAMFFGLDLNSSIEHMSLRLANQHSRFPLLWWLIPGWSCDPLFSKQCFPSLTKKFSREGNGNLLQYSCLENPMDGGAWWAAVHGGAKSWTRLSDFTFTFHFHALEKEMATHSSVLGWRIPGKGEPGRLPSVGSH